MFWKYNSLGSSQIDSLLDRANEHKNRIKEQEDLEQEEAKAKESSLLPDRTIAQDLTLIGHRKL